MRIIVGERQFDRWVREMEERRQRLGAEARETAEEIIAQVRADGDRAVSSIARRFDRVALRPSQLLFEPKEKSIDAKFERAISKAIERVTTFHEKQKDHGYAIRASGTHLVHRVRPLKRVGIYVPGGRAVYLSTLVMCVIPAKIAGVREIVVATPANAAKEDEFQFACARLGIREVYRVGGAAGVAAMAIGTRSLRRVDKIVGPGNRYVAAAKQLLAGEVGIDMIAGPTEIVVVADESSNPAWVAADLLAQAEHGEDTAPVAITNSQEIARAINREIAIQSRAIGRGAARLIGDRGVIVVADSTDAMVRCVNRIGPEHVSLQVRSTADMVDGIENCGAIFLGGWSAVALGDYVAGPNHVLPTSGSGRFHSPLGVYDFHKRTNVVSISHETFREIADDARTLARSEGLELHAASIEIREKR